MNTLTESLKTWIKQIPGDLFELDQTPLLGYPPAFSWSGFAKHIADALQIEDLSFTPSEWRWLSKEELFDGLGDKLKSIPLTVVPLSGNIYWIMPEQAISKLMNRMLARKNNPTSATDIDTEFQNAFYRFLVLEVLDAFEKNNADKKLSPTFSQNESLPSCHCLCQDIAITLQDLNIHGRLFLTPEFRKSWMQHYLQRQNIFSSPIADKLNIIVHLEAGKVSLKPSEWRQLHTGDFILLDACSLDPEEDKGRVQLVVNGIPVFRGKIKDGNIKILEHPLYHEVDAAMTIPPDKHEEEDEDIFDDSELDADLNSESGEENSHDSIQESEIELDIEDELHSDIESDFDIEEEPAKDAAKALKEPAKPAPKKESVKEAEPVVLAKSVTGGAPLSIEEISLNIVVEVGRLQIPIKKLLELQPGNMLELNIHPEAGVDLVLNGKRIAKGELLRIGDALGVRIVDIS